jgi:hypothetical protein
MHAALAIQFQRISNPGRHPSKVSCLAKACMTVYNASTPSQTGSIPGLEERVSFHSAALVYNRGKVCLPNWYVNEHYAYSSELLHK